MITKRSFIISIIIEELINRHKDPQHYKILVLLISGKNSRDIFPAIRTSGTGNFFEWEIKFPGSIFNIPEIWVPAQKISGIPDSRSSYSGKNISGIIPGIFNIRVIWFPAQKVSGIPDSRNIFPGKWISRIGNSRNFLSGKFNSRDIKNRSREEILDSRYFFIRKLTAL